MVVVNEHNRKQLHVSSLVHCYIAFFLALGIGHAYVPVIALVYKAFSPFFFAVRVFRRVVNWVQARQGNRRNV